MALQEFGKHRKNLEKTTKQRRKKYSLQENSEMSIRILGLSRIIRSLVRAGGRASLSSRHLLHVIFTYPTPRRFEVRFRESGNLFSIPTCLFSCWKFMGLLTFFQGRARVIVWEDHKPSWSLYGRTSTERQVIYLINRGPTTVFFSQ